jgi:hypothetical protein
MHFSRRLRQAKTALLLRTFSSLELHGLSFPLMSYVSRFKCVTDVP